MKDIKLNATIIPVAAKFTASPGDRLLVINGSCIGLYVPDAPAARTKLAASSEATVTEEMVLDVTREHGPISANSISSRLGLEVRDKAARAITSYLIKVLLSKNLIRRTSAARVPDYEAVVVTADIR